MPHLTNLANCEAALELIKATDDKIVRNLLDMAFMEFIRHRFAENGEAHAPQSEFDILYCMHVLKTFFSNREVIMQVLSGQEPEAWFEASETGIMVERVSNLAS